MKSYKILIAALLVLPVFFSCGGKNNHTPDNPNTPSTPSTPSNPTTPTNPDNPPTPPTPPEPEPEPPIEFRRTVRFGQVILSFNSSNDFIAIYPESVMTKSGDSRKISTGTYTFSQEDKTYTLKDLGKLEVLKDDKVAFTPKDGERKEYTAKTSLIVDNEKTEAYLVNKSWTINESILKFRGANYSFDGLDLNEVEKIARDQGIQFKYHMKDGMVAKKLIVTDALVAAEFKNGESYAAEHTLRSGTSFDLSEFTNALKGSATIQFDKEDPQWCYLTIKTTLDESPAEVVFTLKEIK
ncbi:MAG: hypothetical protein IKH60_07920 [Bacteroidales bacterium]|jgi:hypothetical protein|nr:hypothetical protein [Bacteroidales bacterium]